MILFLFRQANSRKLIAVCAGHWFASHIATIPCMLHKVSLFYAHGANETNPRDEGQWARSMTSPDSDILFTNERVGGNSLSDEIRSVQCLMLIWLFA